MEVADGSIEFDHVDFSYKKDSKEPVLKDINLSIPAGETLLVLLVEPEVPSPAW